MSAQLYVNLSHGVQVLKATGTAVAVCAGRRRPGCFGDSDMRAAVFFKTPDLDHRLSRALRLRWPDTEVLHVSKEDQLVETASRVDLIFVDDVSTSGGFEVIRKARAAWSGGIIFLTSEPTDEGMLDALEAGADDYLSASFSPTQLVARVSALLRRLRMASGRGDSVVQCGSLRIHLDSHEVYVDGQELALTPTEFNLLHHLALAGGGTVTAKTLQKLVWECETPLYMETLRKYVQRLRRKLQQLGDSDVGIISIRGVGYRLAYSRE